MDFMARAACADRRIYSRGSRRAKSDNDRDEILDIVGCGFAGRAPASIGYPIPSPSCAGMIRYGADRLATERRVRTRLPRRFPIADAQLAGAPMSIHNSARRFLQPFAELGGDDQRSSRKVFHEIGSGAV